MMLQGSHTPLRQEQDRHAYQIHNSDISTCQIKMIDVAFQYSLQTKTHRKRLLVKAGVTLTGARKSATVKIDLLRNPETVQT